MNLAAGIAAPPQHDLTSLHSSVQELQQAVLNDQGCTNLIEYPSINRVLQMTVDAAGTDAHCRPDKPILYRHGGNMGILPDVPPMTTADMDFLLQCAGGTPGKTGMVWGGGRRWRLTVFQSTEGLHAAFRRLEFKPPPYAQLGLPDSLWENALSFHDGLLLIVGATGSGKTTTAASIVEMINRTRRSHILTIENPVEYVYQSEKSLITQRNIKEGESVDALKTAMRSDPDVVFLGEAISQEDFDVCLQLASTGHFVITTMHARDCSTAVERIASYCGVQGRSALSQTLRAVLSQRLLPPPNPTRDGWRVLAVETVYADAAVRNFIRPDGELPRLRRHLSDAGIAMDRVLVNLVKEGKLDIPTARSACLDTDDFDDYLS